MIIGTIQMKSRALDRTVTYTILLPDPAEVGEGPYPVLVQLHGRNGNHTRWLYNSNLHTYAKNLPLIIVLPDGANSLWANLHSTLRYEDFVVQDLWEHINATFPVRKDSPWAIGGLSMGGYGAIHLGLKYPEKYCSIYAHSSVIPTYDELLTSWMEQLTFITPERATDLDCYHLAEEIEPAKLPRLSFDCGTEDGLLEHNQRFHAHLQELGLAHSYAEYPGAHTWDYWDLHVQEALRQHAEVLNIQPVE
jgi:S-formylglutathione hydrolase FrmB